MSRTFASATAITAVFLLLQPYAAAQDLPAQCDPATTLMPANLMFLGPALFVKIGAINYTYHRFGKQDSDKPPLVLIQGLGTTQYGWPLAMLEELSLTREVVIFDNALVGLSVDTQASQRSLPLTIAFMAASTADLIKAMNFSSAPDVMGISMGGMVALTLAANHGDAVRSVVSVASTYGGSQAPQPASGIAAAVGTLQAQQAQGAVDLGLLFPNGVNDTGYCNAIRDNLSLQFAGIPGFMGLEGSGYGAGSIIPSPEAAAIPADAYAKQGAAVVQFFEGYGLLPRLATGTNQLMFIGGVQDKLIPITTQTAAAAAIPGSWLVQIPDAGHGVVYQRPKEFAEQVLTFLDSAQEMQPNEQFTFYGTSAATSAVHTAVLGSLCAAAVALLALA